MANISKNTKGKKFTIKKMAKIGIVQSLYNPEITGALLKSCLKELAKAGVAEKNVFTTTVPGAFELPLACQRMIKNKKPDAVIALGLVIQGETPHFDFVAGETARGIMKVSLKTDTPVIFGVLTTNTLQQAKDRTGGKRGDKGIEAAQAALHMIG